MTQPDGGADRRHRARRAAKRAAGPSENQPSGGPNATGPDAARAPAEPPAPMLPPGKAPESPGTSRRSRRQRADEEPGYRPSQISAATALRAREVAVPTAEDIARAERDLVLVRRHYSPPGALAPTPAVRRSRKPSGTPKNQPHSDDPQRTGPVGLAQAGDTKAAGSAS